MYAETSNEKREGVTFMKLMRFIAFLLLAGVTLTAAAGKPEPVETLRRDALAKMRAFVESRPQSPASEQAERILAQEAADPDPNRWIGDTIRFGRSVLRENPPQSNRDEIRRAALQILDIPLSVEDTDPAAPAGFGQAWRETINSIYQPVCDEMLDEILKTRVASGVRIWKRRITPGDSTYVRAIPSPGNSRPTSWRNS